MTGKCQQQSPNAINSTISIPTSHCAKLVWKSPNEKARRCKKWEKWEITSWRTPWVKVRKSLSLPHIFSPLNRIITCLTFPLYMHVHSGAWGKVKLAVHRCALISVSLLLLILFTFLSQYFLLNKYIYIFIVNEPIGKQSKRLQLKSSRRRMYGNKIWVLKSRERWISWNRSRTRTHMQCNCMKSSHQRPRFIWWVKHAASRLLLVAPYVRSEPTNQELDELSGAWIDYWRRIVW